MESAVFEGKMVHVRAIAPIHKFSYHMRLWYVSLDDLPLLAKHTFFGIKHGFCGLFPRDFLPEYGHDSKDSESLQQENPLKLAAEQCIYERTGKRFTGKINLLAAPRIMGIGFNPLALFYCFDLNNELRYVIAEVRNTPWTERHVYFLDMQRPASMEHEKAFHVSPFMDMDQKYSWTLPTPDEALRVVIQNSKDEETVFTAALQLKKMAPLTVSSLNREIFTHWPQSIKTLIGIYWQAVKLLIKGARFHHHPGQSSDTNRTTDSTSAGKAQK